MKEVNSPKISDWLTCTSRGYIKACKLDIQSFSLLIWKARRSAVDPKSEAAILHNLLYL